MPWERLENFANGRWFSRPMSVDLSLRRPAEGKKLTPDLAELKKKLDGTFEREYQRWYTEASAVLRQIIPERLAEFQQLYRSEPKRKNIDIATYSIQDWLGGRTGSRQRLYRSEGLRRFRLRRDALQYAVRDLEGR